MWYLSPAEDQHESEPPNDIVAAIDSDLRPTVGGNVEPGERSPSAKALGRAKASAASNGPGSEYWLP